MLVVWAKTPRHSFYSMYPKEMYRLILLTALVKLAVPVVKTRLSSEWPTAFSLISA